MIAGSAGSADPAWGEARAPWCSLASPPARPGAQRTKPAKGQRDGLRKSSRQQRRGRRWHWPPSARRAGGGGSRPPASSRGEGGPDAGPSVSPTRGREPGTAGASGAHRTRGWPPEGRPTQDARPGPCGDRGDGGRRVTAWSTSCRGLCSGRPSGWGSCFRPSPRCRTWSRLGLSLQREQDA